MSTPSPDFYPVTPEQMVSLSRELVTLSESLQRRRNPAWLTAARAAALVDGVRLGLVKLDAGGVYGSASH